MKTGRREYVALFVIAVFAVFVVTVIGVSPGFIGGVAAKQQARIETVPLAKATPKFNIQKTTVELNNEIEKKKQRHLALLMEQIKGREREPAGEVFKNLKIYNKAPAGALLRLMNFGYSRALGVDCSHCHTPENWAAETKPAKQTAREMQALSGKIRQDLRR